MITELEKAELEKFLDTNLYKRVKEQVIKEATFILEAVEPTQGHLLLAQEKGVHKAFRLIEGIVKRIPRVEDPKVKSVHPKNK